MCRFLPLIFFPHRSHADRCKTPFFSAFHALAVDDRGRRRCLALGPFATFDIERVMDAVERAVPAPQIEIIVQRRAWAAGLSGSRAIGSPCSGCTSNRWQSRAHSPFACYHRASPAGSAARSAPIPHRSGRSDSAGGSGHSGHGLQSSTSAAAPPRIRPPSFNHNRIHPTQYVRGQTLTFGLRGPRSRQEACVCKATLRNILEYLQILRLAATKKNPGGSLLSSRLFCKRWGHHAGHGGACDCNGTRTWATTGMGQYSVHFVSVKSR